MVDRSELFDFLAKKIGEVLKSKADRDEKLKTVCRLLRDNVSYYNWVGFYIVDRKRQKELVLGPFEGEPTEHARIPFGRGICGQAAERRKTFLVQDVSKETNYLSCSANVKSEIVVPIFKNEEVVGELDIDSHALSPFTKEDETFLKKIGEMASKIL
ncbi:MAG: GAF domain-containing protein [Candidatus Bathyarchaeia archaeon]|jgi:GAF domain-containing protein